MAWNHRILGHFSFIILQFHLKQLKKPCCAPFDFLTLANILIKSKRLLN